MDPSSDQTPIAPAQPDELAGENESPGENLKPPGPVPGETAEPAVRRTPDFELEKITALTAAWLALAEAIQRVNEASAGAERVYRRGVEALQNQLELTRELIKEDENASLARLKSQKQDLSPEEYAGERERIQNVYGDQERAAEIQTAASGVALKVEEQTGLQNTARQKAAQADAIRPPANDPAEARIEDQRRVRLRQEAVVAQEKAQTIKNELPEDQAREHTREVIATLNLHGGKTNQALGELATTVGLTERQKLTIVERMLSHQLTAQQVWAGLEWRLAQLESQQQNAGNHGLSQ